MYNLLKNNDEHSNNWIMKILTFKALEKKCIIIIGVLLIQNVSNCQNFNINQTLSDGAQRNTIAFDGLAFLTGNFCACSFIPPGKVADYFGFQFLRDNDPTHMGHNTDFLTVIANNLLFVLDSAQREQMIALAQTQVPLINQYGKLRFPLIDAFVRMRDNTMPVGSIGLNKEIVKCYSSDLYRLDGIISLQRAQLYAGIINSLSLQQRQYLDSVSGLGMQNMPVLPDQIDKTIMSHNAYVAVMSYAGDIFAWYAGNIAADVYFCPERQGNYFGGFYIKDAPAMGNAGYSIDTNLTQNGGVNFLAALTTSQALQVTELVDTQRTALYSIVDRRTDISSLLCNYISNVPVDTSEILNLSEIYGELDGEISYYYATHFSYVNWTLSTSQRMELDSIRNLDDYPCTGAYLYSDPIGAPDISGQGTIALTLNFNSNWSGGPLLVSAENCAGASTPRDLKLKKQTRFSGIQNRPDNTGFQMFEPEFKNSVVQLSIYPNPAMEILKVDFSENITADAYITISNLYAQILYSEKLNSRNEIEINLMNRKPGIYEIQLYSDNEYSSKKFIIK